MHSEELFVPPPTFPLSKRRVEKTGNLHGPTVSVIDLCPDGTHHGRQHQYHRKLD